MTDAGPQTAAPPSPLRWRMPLALLVVSMINWFDRSGMSLALPRIAAEHQWTTAEIGANGARLISTFFLGYGLANMFLSPVAERYGPRKALMLSVVAFSICTALNAPLGATVSALVALRFVLGLAEGIHFPMAGAIVSRWFPLGERSRANGLYIFGVQIAVIVGPLLMVPMITQFGWRTMFLVLGGLGLVVALPAVIAVLRDDGPYAPPAGAPATSPFVVFRNPNYWLILLAGICSNVILYGLLAWLPTYLAEGRHMAFADLAANTSAPYWFATLAIPFWAIVGDRTNKRALFASLGCGLSGTFVLLGARAPSLLLTIVFLSAANFFQNAYQTAEFAFAQRVLPADRVGAGTGLYNGISIIIGGAGGTALIGKVVEATGSYDSGLMVVVVAGWLNMALLALLYRRIRY